MDDFDRNPAESAELKAITQRDPSGGVNPEWYWQKPGDEEYVIPSGESAGGLGQGLLALILSAAFLFLAILSW